MNNRLRALLATLCMTLFASGAQAHKASDAYLSVGESPTTIANAVPLRLSLALKDIDAALQTLDADGDRRLTWGETQAALPNIVRWVDAGLTLRCASAPAQPAWGLDSLEQRSDGVYLRLGAQITCAAPAAVKLDYGLMQDIDPTHRLLLQSGLDGQRQAAVLAPGARSSMELARRGAPASGPATLANFFTEGVQHILSGYDHLAFLLALLLPISLLARERSSGLAKLLFTVTGFTLGHSVTLALATLGWISASPTWVEPAIAMSIGASALLNLYPVRGLRTDVLAVAFGLVHGLGFSGVMTEAGLSGTLLVWALAGFNLGVEAGQLMMVAAWCALHLLLVRWSHYSAVVVRGGSFALLLLAVYWTIPRALG
jgi:HupE / UreJ protein